MIAADPPLHSASLNSASLKVEWALLLVLALAAVAVGQHPRRGLDFRVYLTAAERFREGTDLYRVEDGAMPFKYAPVTAPLFLPFTAVPPRAAVALWNLGSVLALAAVSVLTRRAAPANGEAAPWEWAPVLATAVLLPALTFEFFYGQVDAVLLWLLVAAAVGAERGRVWGPGAAFAVACLLKPPAALLGLFFLARRHWRVVGATALFGVLLVLPTLGRYGWEGTLSQVQDWTRTLARTTPPWALGHNPQGLPTLLLSLVLPPESLPPAGAMTLAQAVAVGLFVIAWVWARPGPVELLAFGCLGVTLLSPLAWRANYVLAWPLIRAALEGRSRSGQALVGLVALTGVLVSETVLGAELARRVLLTRPFVWAYTALLLTLLWQTRRRGAPTAVLSDGAVTHLPREFPNARAS
ncbi:glycosyltransferase family 87 protein [Corallococcus sp. bb12-1]|uniref:glycosyltransferase family 87 protein n=1 Tax=Corallococcus sp. bb12-1 TaxID=2996784 RepID=UPI0022708477|nr:glycosyltransferase family 87 protein [Corallococcus sp. bb12-1]MCY1040603.1 glycosyltransferase family 87 protein [Corallococcus sp. bb12-1]